MAEAIISLKKEGFRETSRSIATINKKLEQLMILADQAAHTLSKMNTGSAVAAANAAKANVKATSTAKKAATANEQVSKSAKNRADEEVKQLRRVTARYEQELAKRAQAQRAAARRMEAVTRKKTKRSELMSTSSLRGGVGLAATAVAGGAAFGISQMKKQIALEERLTALRIQGRSVGEEGANVKDMSNKILNTAMQYGLDPSDITGGIEEIVTRTGDLKTALKAMSAMAEISSATGASFEDLGGATAELMTKFGMKEPEEFRKSLAVLAMMGKKGAFELKDMAEYLPEVAAAAKVYGASGEKGMVEMAAMLQIAKSGTGSPAEAATAMRSLYTDLTKSKGLNALKKKGVRVFDVDKKTGAKTGRSLFELLPEIMHATKGNADELNKIFGDRGKKAVAPLADVYKNTLKETGSTDAATKAVIDKLKETANAEGALAEMKRDAAEKQNTASAKLNKAWAKVQMAFSKVDFEPIIEAIPSVMEALKLLAEVIVSITKWFLTVTGQKGQALQLEAQVQERKAMNDRSKVNSRYEKKIAELGPITDANRNQYNKLIAERDKELSPINARIEAATNAQREGKKSAENSASGAIGNMIDKASRADPKELVEYQYSGGFLKDFMNTMAMPVNSFIASLLGITDAADKAKAKLDSLSKANPDPL